LSPSNLITRYVIIKSRGNGGKPFLGKKVNGTGKILTGIKVGNPKGKINKGFLVNYRIREKPNKSLKY